MISTTKRSTRRWAATAVAVGSATAMLATPLALSSASAQTAAAKTATEKPILRVTNVRAGVISLHAQTKPALQNATVYFYEVVQGDKKVVGYNVTGDSGHAHVRVHMAPGSTHAFVARAVGLNNPRRYHQPSPRTTFHSKYSNKVTRRFPS